MRQSDPEAFTATAMQALAQSGCPGARVCAARRTDGHRGCAAAGPSSSLLLGAPARRHAPFCSSPAGPAGRRGTPAAPLGASSGQGPSTSGKPEEPDISYDFVAQNAGLMRALPLWAGGLGIASLIANRVLSGIAPVVDASSSQSRADVLGIVLSAVLLLTGLQWLALQPRKMEAVEQNGTDVDWVDPEARLPPAAAQELQWAWDALRTATRCRCGGTGSAGSVAVVWRRQAARCCACALVDTACEWHG